MAGSTPPPLTHAPAGLHPHWRQEALALGLALELHSWGHLPRELPRAGCVLLADEAHFAQNLSARCAQAFLRLARHPRLRAAWLLTGTPMTNGRLGEAQLARAIRRELEKEGNSI